MQKIFFLFSVVFFTFFISCKCTKPTKAVASQAVGSNFKTTGPAAVIYKTKKDYSQFVPVNLSDDGSKIISYPAPTDVFYNDTLALPTPLKNGYWLDNRGVNLHSVFINITYEAYSKLQNAPSLDDMYAKIIDKNPFTEFYACGLKSSYGEDFATNLNKLIDAGGLQQCKCWKK